MALFILVVVGIAAFGVDVPKCLGGFVLEIALSIAALFAIGLWIAAVTRTATAAGAISSAVFLPLTFFASLWVPHELMAPALRDVSDVTPLGASVQAIQGATQGRFPPATSLLALVVYAVTFGLLAVRLFKRE